MAAYKDLVGQKITKVTSNPGEPKTGQMWYNSTDGKLRGLGITSAWRSSAPILVARDAAGSAGTQTTATIFGGNINPGNTNSTDEYNGSGFSSGGTLNTARRQTSGCGLQTAALCVAGYTTANAANVEEYNGTSWSEQNDIPGNYRNGSTFGTQTAALYVGGYSAPVPNSTTIQIYDGTNWTTSPATLGTGGNSISSTGTSTAGLVFGGSNRLNVTEEWNGSAMSTGGNMSTSKYGRGSANQAPSENAMSAGGGIPAQTTVENYDGTSWSTLPSLAVATNSIKGAGTASSAMMMGGGPGAGPVFNTSTEFDQSTNTITAAAWASGGNLNTGRQDVGGCGTKSAGLAIGGRTGSSGPFTQANNSEEYDGTSWTEGNNLNTARGEGSGAGTQTAAVYFGGAPDSNATENYNGTSWTTSPGTLNTGRSSGASFGASYTSAVFCGGYGGARIANVEEWNGSAWTNATALPEARYNAGGAGIESAGIVLGGSNAPAGTVVFSTSVEYNGSSWTAVGTNHTSLEGQGMNGTQTACISYGGPTSLTANSSTYDGTTFVTSPNMAANRSGLGASKGASITNTMGFGGSTPPNRQMNNTEEFTSEVETANVTDFTTS